MFYIKKEQLKAFEIVKFPFFERKMMEHIQRHFDQQAAIIGKSALSKFIHYGHKCAEKYNFITGYESCLYIDLMIMLGHGFDTDPQLPWVKEILTGSTFSDTTQQIELLYKRALGYMEITFNKDQLFPGEQFQNMINFSFEEFNPASEASSMKNILNFFRTFWPQKFETTVINDLEILIRAGISKANRHGFTTNSNVKYFVTLMFLLGHRFDTDPQYPWLTNVLNNPKLEGEQYKIDCLHFMVKSLFEVLLQTEEIKEN